MYNCNFSDVDKQIIGQARLYDSDPIVRKRMNILWLKSLDYPHHEIAKISGACLTTVTKTIRKYMQDGLDNVKRRDPYRPESQLEDYRDIIIGHFAKHPPASLGQAASEVEKLTGIKLGQGAVRNFLISNGIYRRKVGMVPGKADPDEQESFINNKLQPILDEAKEGKRQVYFVDAAHFVLAPFLGFLWSLVRVFIKAPAGRQRFNVLGAINAITHEFFSITNDTYINAISVCDLLRKIAARHAGEVITLILDNAKYQKCIIVTELAKSLNIDLLYLPPYSPNLNIIERLWRFVKNKALYSRYYDSFPKFRSAISNCLDEIDGAYKSEIEKLLKLKFQRIRKSQIITI